MAILQEILQFITRYQARRGSLEGARLMLSPARAAELGATIDWWVVRTSPGHPVSLYGLPVEVDSAVEDIELWTPAPSRLRWVLLPSGIERRPSRIPLAPSAFLLSGSGYYGQACPREIPDTPLDEWNTGVEALLAEHDHWQADAARVLREET